MNRVSVVKNIFIYSLLSLVMQSRITNHRSKCPIMAEFFLIELDLALVNILSLKSIKRSTDYHGIFAMTSIYSYNSSRLFKVELNSIHPSHGSFQNMVAAGHGRRLCKNLDSTGLVASLVVPILCSVVPIPCWVVPILCLSFPNLCSHHCHIRSRKIHNHRMEALPWIWIPW